MSGFIPIPSVISFSRYRSPEYKKALLGDLLDCIKECQNIYGKKGSLATEDDPK